MTPRATRRVGVRATVGTALALGILHLALAHGSSLRAPRGTLDHETIQLRLDPNRASAAELELLPGVGPKLAARIAATRARPLEQPAFRSPADLDRVPGVGSARVTQLTPFLRFESTGEPSPPSAAEP